MNNRTDNVLPTKCYDACKLRSVLSRMFVVDQKNLYIHMFFHSLSTVYVN